MSFFQKKKKKKKKKEREKKTELHKQGLQNVISSSNKEVKISTLLWTAEFISFAIAVTYIYIYISYHSIRKDEK
jgi:hypothetical protein